MLTWWRKGLRNCCLVKICQVLEKGFALLWPSQMPLLISVVCSLSCTHIVIEKLFTLSKLANASKFKLPFLFFFFWVIKFKLCTWFNLDYYMQHVATVFGQLWRLEPLPSEKKEMWRREMDWLVSVSDHIVELIPSWQTFPDGKKLEVK